MLVLRLEPMSCACKQAFHTHTHTKLYSWRKTWKASKTELSRTLKKQNSSASAGILSSDFPSKPFISISQIKTKQKRFFGWHPHNREHVESLENGCACFDEVHVFCLHTCKALDVQPLPAEARKGTGFLGLVLQMSLRCHVSAGTLTRILH